MGLFNRLIVIVMVLSAVACNLGGAGGSGGDEEEEGEEQEVEVEAGGVANGEYEGIDTVAINLILDDLNSNAPPTEGDCFGDIDIVIDDGEDPEIVGDGECFFPANFMTYTLEGEFVDDENWEGEIVVVLNNRPYAFDVEGELDGDEISGAFSGVNIVVGSIRGIWDGVFSAELL